MNRKMAREQAFLLIFEKAFTDESVDLILESAIESGIYKEDAFSTEEIHGVFDHIDVIDDLIKQNIKNWSFSRLSKVSLAILRLAIYEIKFVDNIPDSVSINEAVELAKKFGLDDDAKYINGVLSSVVK